MNNQMLPIHIDNPKSYHFLDLVDLPTIQQLFDAFYTMTGIQYSILDTDNKILIKKGWQDLCVNFHRTCPLTEARCQKSDSYIHENLKDSSYVSYKCLNGLMEYATPIIVEGQHLATIFLGQLLHDQPDGEFFRRQAREFGFNETEYMEALSRIPIIPRENVITVIEFYAELGRILASLGLERLQQQKLANVLWQNPEPISITTLYEGRYVEVNEAWIEATGFSREETIGATSTDLGIWNNPEERDALIKIIEVDGKVRNFETSFRSKKGDLNQYSISVEPIYIANQPHLLFVCEDITERHKTQEALRLSEQQFSKAFDASPSAESISSLVDGRFVAVNDAFCRIVGYTKEEMMGIRSLDLDIWVNPEDRKLIKRMMQNGETVRDMEFSFRRKSGEIWIGLFSAVKLMIDGEQCMLNIASDITARKKAEEEIKYLSFHDKLTGIYNRAFFEMELKRLDTKRQLPISLIMGDVNGLKLINDALGHHEGDTLLIGLASILKMSCREEDIVARWGGDEFIILLPQCDHDTAALIVNRIYEHCRHISDQPIQTSISLGLATKYNVRTDLNEIIKEAEDKMYRHKLLVDRSTRNSFLVSLQNTLWSRSHETKEHCERIQALSLRIGEAISLPDCDLDSLKLLSLLHDIGKIAIPNSILDKPDKLTPDEWDTIKKHPEIGYRIALSSPDIAPIAEGILHHHERWDGTGYPMGLKGQDIPLISRIIAIADAYDVMINGRPYQQARKKEVVWEEIKNCAGSQFDPYLVDKACDVIFGI